MLSDATGLALVGAIVVYERIITSYAPGDSTTIMAQATLTALRKDLRQHFSAEFEEMARQTIEAGMGFARDTMNQVLMDDLTGVALADAPDEPDA